MAPSAAPTRTCWRPSGAGWAPAATPTAALPTRSRTPVSRLPTSIASSWPRPYRHSQSPAPLYSAPRSGPEAPPLPADHVILPDARVPVVARPDVLVVGGGSAGLSAAVAAARGGADVMLLERFNYLGGLATGGLIILLLTLDDGAGRQVIGGLCQELVDRMEKRNAVYYPPKSEWGDPDPKLVEP